MHYSTYPAVTFQNKVNTRLIPTCGSEKKGLTGIAVQGEVDNKFVQWPSVAVLVISKDRKIEKELNQETNI